MTITRREFVAAGAAVMAAGAAAAEAQERLPRRQLRALRAAVRGRVLAPGDRGYDRARVVFNRRFDGVRPPAVVRVRDAADVQAVVRWAERFDVPLTARSGGHAYHGGSTSRDAVVVDLRALDRVALVDGTTAGGDRTAAGGDRIAAGGGGIAAVGPGARIIDVYAALARRGVTVPAGSCPTVAIGGLMTGGGVGLAGRALGLTLDRVTSLDVVTADGRLRRVDDGDLFWALRGGGGSFGIVTGIRLRVHRVRRAAWFRITYPAASRAEALAAWDDLAPGAPDDLTSILVLTASGATAFGQYLGPERALRRIVAPLRRVPGASASAGTSGYLDLQKRWAGCADGGLPACRRYERSSFAASSAYVARRLSGAGRRALLDAAETGATLILDAYGGAIGRVAPDETAFVHRDVRYSVQILSYAALPVARARVRRARRLVAPYGNGRAYQNYADPDLRGARRAYYGRNYERLVRIKGEVDPGNRFRVAQGIRAR